MFCPYCGRGDCTAMSKEHVIPQTIGGNHQTVIDVCKSCNDRAGARVDTLFRRHVVLQLSGTLSGADVHRNTRLQATGRLKDGHELDGYVFTEAVVGDPNKFKVKFDPLPRQPDGTRWVSARAAKGNLPESISVLEDAMVDTISFVVPAPDNLGLEPAILKILLGILHLHLGERYLSLPAFGVLRSSVFDSIHPSVTVKWWPNLKARPTFSDPLRIPDVHPRQHFVWFSNEDGAELRGGVCLYGRFVTEVWVEKFDIRFPAAGLLIDSRPVAPAK